MKTRKLFIVVIAFGFLFFESCGILQTFQNISRLQFKLGSVNNLLLNGIDLTTKTKVQDFSATEILKLSTSVLNKKMPVSFVLNVNALNPNDGSAGKPKTDYQLTKFPWTLLIDDKETISGDIDSPISVPGSGQTVNFPLKIQLDLYSFFQDKGYEDMIKLAMNISGKGNSEMNVKLVAQPTISSPLGNITYPEKLTIVNKQFTN